MGNFGNFTSVVESIGSNPYPVSGRGRGADTHAGNSASRLLENSSPFNEASDTIAPFPNLVSWKSFIGILTLSSACITLAAVAKSRCSPSNVNDGELGTLFQNVELA